MALTMRKEWSKFKAANAKWEKQRGARLKFGSKLDAFEKAQLDWVKKELAADSAMSDFRAAWEEVLTAAREYQDAVEKFGNDDKLQASWDAFLERTIHPASKLLEGTWNARQHYGKAVTRVRP